jgi:predicted nuclease of predicted toxin-antitoxin system
MRRALGVEASALRDLGLRDAADREIFFAARKQAAVILTKDADFADLLVRHGAPPRVLWVTAGNTSNERLERILIRVWPRVLHLLEAGETLIEVGGPEDGR